MIGHALEVMQASKVQIFDICESAREEYEHLKKELAEVAANVSETIGRVDLLERKFRQARAELGRVSREFAKYKEEDIRRAYESAHAVQTELSITQEKEKNLRSRRDELQQRLKKLERTIEKAEALITQVGVAVDYLSGDLSDVARMLETAKNRQILGLKVILAQEEERKRVAREIHDGPAQSMAHLVLRSEIVERMLEKNDYDAMKKELAELKSLVRGSLEEVRKIIFDLRPMGLDDLGLVPTLRKHIHNFEEKTQLSAEFVVKGGERRLSSPLEVALYRLIQESLNNVAKHAEATRVLVELHFLEEEIFAGVQDNGAGFSAGNEADTTAAAAAAMTAATAPAAGKSAAGRPAAQPAQNPPAIAGPAQFGLMGMKERVELLDGKMNIFSAPNKGTRITFRIPLKTAGTGGIEE